MNIKKYKMGRRGKFITLEGPEGCGKSTQARLLYGFLRRLGYRCILTREPGGTPLGEEIRKLLLDPKNRGMNPACETLLFEASRAELVEKVVSPSLSQGLIVICDRFSDATLVYQGFAGNGDLKTIRRLNEFAAFGVKPDITFVLDISAQAGLRRAKKASTRKEKLFKWDRMERKSLRFHRAVRNGYLKLARIDRKRIKVIETQTEIEKTQQLIRQHVLRILNKA